MIEQGMRQSKWAQQPGLMLRTAASRSLKLQPQPGSEMSAPLLGSLNSRGPPVVTAQHSRVKLLDSFFTRPMVLRCQAKPLKVWWWTLLSYQEIYFQFSSVVISYICITILRTIYNLLMTTKLDNFTVYIVSQSKLLCQCPLPGLPVFSFFTHTQPYMNDQLNGGLNKHDFNDI